MTAQAKSEAQQMEIERLTHELLDSRTALNRVTKYIEFWERLSSAPDRADVAIRTKAILMGLRDALRGGGA